MTDELNPRIQRFRRKLAAASDPEDQADYRASIAALEKERDAIQSQTIGGNAQIGVAVAGDIHGNIYLDGRRADQAAKLLAGYLRQLRGRCGSLPLEGVRQQKQVDDVLAVRLDQVYTQLAVEGTVIRERFAGDDLRPKPPPD